MISSLLILNRDFKSFSGGGGGDFSASLSEHSNKRYNK